MASMRKAKQFLEASDTHKHYSEIVDYVIEYFVTKAEGEGRSQFAAELRKEKNDYRTEFAQAIETTEEVYCDIFSDEELDDLIVLHSNPTIEKLRGLTAEIMGKVLQKYSRASG